MPNEPATLFEARKVQVGGIYPFKIPETFRSEKAAFKFLKQDFPQQSLLKELRHKIFEADLQWADGAKIYAYDSVLEELQLSSGKVFSRVSLNVNLISYPIGFGTIILWLSFGDAVLSDAELIEVISLVRGDVSSSRQTAIKVSFDSQKLEARHCIDLFKEIESDFLGYSESETDYEKLQFVHPLLYVGCVAGCDSALQIVDKHKLSITAISNRLHIPFKEKIKPKEIATTLECDVHPFTYGLTIPSSHCTAEYHPDNSHQELKNNYQIDTQQFKEKMYLTFMAESFVSHYHALRFYNMKLDKQNEKFVADRNNYNHPYTWLHNLLDTFKRIPNLFDISDIRHQMTETLANFRGPQLKLIIYLQRASIIYDASFGIKALEKEVDEKLKALGQVIETKFRTLFTVLAIVIAIGGIGCSLVNGFVSSLNFIASHTDILSKILPK